MTLTNLQDPENTTMESLIGSKLAEVMQRLSTGNKLVQFQVRFLAHGSPLNRFIVFFQLKLGYRKGSFKLDSASFK